MGKIVGKYFLRNFLRGALSHIECLLHVWFTPDVPYTWFQFMDLAKPGWGTRIVELAAPPPPHLSISYWRTK
jgi:hypothetical protein